MVTILPEEALELLDSLSIYRGNYPKLTLACRERFSLFNLMALGGLCEMVESIPRTLLPKNENSYRQFLSGRRGLRATIAAWMRNEPVTFDVMAGEAERYPLWLLRSSLNTAIEERRKRYSNASASVPVAPLPSPATRTSEIALGTAVTPKLRRSLP